MGVPLGGDVLVEVGEAKAAPEGLGRWLGAILAGLGAVGWGMVALGLNQIWGSYDPEVDVLGIHLIGGGIAAVALVLIGGAASCTLAVVGGLLSLGRLLRARRLDGPVAAGLGMAALVLAPLAWVVFRLMAM